MIVGCAALYPFPSGESRRTRGTRRAARNRAGSAMARKLVDQLSDEAKQRGFRKLFVLTTRATHWFIERGSREPRFRASAGQALALQLAAAFRRCSSRPSDRG